MYMSWQRIQTILNFVSKTVFARKTLFFRKSNLVYGLVSADDESILCMYEDIRLRKMVGRVSVQRRSYEGAVSHSKSFCKLLKKVILKLVTTLKLLRWRRSRS